MSLTTDIWPVWASRSRGPASPLANQMPQHKGHHLLRHWPAELPSLL
jgi:hypothetical protein